MNYPVIILSAGASTRMSVHKALYPVNGKPWIQVQIESLMECGIKEIGVVLGYQAKEIQKHLFNTSLRICENPKPERGLFSSVQCGLQMFEAPAYFILPVDTPAPSKEVWQLMEDAFQNNVVIPEYDGKGGHPVLISNDVKKRILKTSSDNRLDEVLREEKNLLRILVSDKRVSLNLNTDADFKRCQVLFHVTP